MRRIVMIALAVIVTSAPAVAVSRPSAGRPEPCRVTQAEFARHVQFVYRNATIRPGALAALGRLRACGITAKARENMRAEQARQGRKRFKRLHPWEYARSQLSADVRATLKRLRGCETRGLAFPANYRQKGHHRGAYQYDFATWREAGGTGDPADASPAEQDVRTARFFFSHRGRWECKA